MERKRGLFGFVCFFFYRNSRWLPLNGACNHLHNTSVDEPWNDEEKNQYLYHGTRPTNLCCVQSGSVRYGKKKPFSSFFNSIKVLIFHPGYIYSYYSSIEHAKDSALEILRWMRSILNSLLISKERTWLCLIKLVPMVPMEHWFQQNSLLRWQLGPVQTSNFICAESNNGS